MEQRDHVGKGERDKDGRLYDSRKGLGSYYRYGPRKISDLTPQLLTPQLRGPRTRSVR